MTNRTATTIRSWALGLGGLLLAACGADTSRAPVIVATQPSGAPTSEAAVTRTVDLQALAPAAPPKAADEGSPTRAPTVAAPPEAPKGDAAEKGIAAEKPAAAEKKASPPADTTTVWRVPIDGSPARGPATALVTLVMFGDFQCPYCAKSAATVDELTAKYGDKLRVVFKHNPLSFHLRAEPAAELALEARAEKGDEGFWKAWKLLFDNQQKLEDADLKGYAATLGLRADRVARVLKTKFFGPAIERDQGLADELGATGTPAFFVNGRRVQGAQRASVFEAIIDEEIQRAQMLISSGVPAAKIYDALQKDAKSGPPPERIVVPAPTSDNPAKGAKAGAKVTVQMFADLECPFCKKAQPVLDELIAAYPGKVRVVWRHLPLPTHPNAQMAAEASVEAFRQKGDAGFWAMAKALFEALDTGLSREAIEKSGAAAGLDMTKLRAALDSGVHRPAVLADKELAERVFIRGTPAFAINDYFVGGAWPLLRFKRLVDRALGPYEAPAPGSLHKAPPPPDTSAQAPATAKVLYGARHLLIMYVGSRRAPATVTRSKEEARALAEVVAKKARAGADFVALVKQYSDEPGAAERGGNLGKFPPGAMVPTFEQALVKLNVNEVSGVVETPFGFHLILRLQ